MLSALLDLRDCPSPLDSDPHSGMLLNVLPPDPCLLIELDAGADIGTGPKSSSTWPEQPKSRSQAEPLLRRRPKRPRSWAWDVFLLKERLRWDVLGRAEVVEGVMLTESGLWGREEGSMVVCG